MLSTKASLKGLGNEVVSVDADQLNS